MRFMTKIYQLLLVVTYFWVLVLFATDLRYPTLLRYRNFCVSFTPTVTMYNDGEIAWTLKLPIHQKLWNSSNFPLNILDLYLDFMMNYQTFLVYFLYFAADKMQFLEIFFSDLVKFLYLWNEIPMNWNFPIRWCTIKFFGLSVR